MKEGALALFAYFLLHYDEKEFIKQRTDWKSFKNNTVVFALVVVTMEACSKKHFHAIGKWKPPTDLNDSLMSIKYGQYNIEFTNNKSGTMPWNERWELIKNIFDKYDFAGNTFLL